MDYEKGHHVATLLRMLLELMEIVKIVIFDKISWIFRNLKILLRKCK